MISKYRNYIISKSPDSLQPGLDWMFIHMDLDSTEDSDDHRFGYGKSEKACRAMIDEIEAELASEGEK